MPREFALPGTRPQYAPDRTCDFQHYRIAIDVQVEAKRVTGSCAITLSPIVERLRWVSLDAVELDIATVRCGDRELPWAHDGRKLRIDLKRDVPAGEQLVLEVLYSASPRRGLYFVGPDEAYPDKPVQVWSQGQDEDSRFWFPCFDSPGEKASSEVIATVPETFFALSNGALIGDSISGGRRTLHWKFDEPHSCYLVTLAAGEFSEIRDQWENVQVQYYVKPGKEDAARRTLGRTPEMLKLFSSKFGVPYPYEKYAQVFVADFIFGGMENTTATTLTDVVLLDERAALDRNFEDLVAHELAHQWFGDLLTCREWGEGWLNEGFATYSEYIWREHANGTDHAAMELEAFADDYFGEDSSRYRRTVATKIYEEPIDIFDHHLYSKGARVLHMLRLLLGDEGFFRSLGHYLAKHRAGSVETRDLARAIEEVTGRALDWFFDQWITESAGHPELTVKYSWDQSSRLAQIAISQTQKVDAQTPLFRIPAKLRFRSGGEQDIDSDVELREQSQTFYVPLPEEPTQAIFDPGRGVLAQVTTDKPQTLWLAELKSATEALDRIAAARALGRSGGTAATRSLIDALIGDPFWGVRGAAAAALGEIRSEASRDALCAALSDESNARVRRPIAQALGCFRRDAAAAAALAAVVEHGDPSYFVEAAACLALGKTRTDQAGALLRVAATRDSFMDVVRRAAYEGLAEANDEAAAPLLTEGTTYGGVSHGRATAVNALAKLVQGRRDRVAREARETLVDLLHDRDFRVQGAAVEGLAILGDPASAPALSALAARDLDGRLRRRCREVLRDLDEAQTKDAQVAKLRDELEAVRAATVELRERLDRAEAATKPAADVPAPPRLRSARRPGGGKKSVRRPRA